MIDHCHSSYFIQRKCNNFFPYIDINSWKCSNHTHLMFLEYQLVQKVDWNIFKYQHILYCRIYTKKKRLTTQQKLSKSCDTRLKSYYKECIYLSLYKLYTYIHSLFLFVCLFVCYFGKKKFSKLWLREKEKRFKFSSPTLQYIQYFDFWQTILFIYFFYYLLYFSWNERITNQSAAYI